MYRIIYFIQLIAIFLFFNLCSFAYARTFQTTDQRFISYTDIGHGKPLVLIHAFPTDKRLFELATKVIESVNDNSLFRIITVDLWGFGHSSSADGQAIRMSDYASDVKQLLDFLEIPSAIIGGESMGGYVALAFFEKYPNKVEGLVLSGTQSIADSPATKAKREALALDVNEHGTANFIKEFMLNALSSGADEKTRMFLKHILEKQDKMAIASALRGMALRNDLSHLLANTSIPIIILAGEKDILISSDQSRRMHALAKNSTLVIMNDAGHLVSLEQPQKWMWDIVDVFIENRLINNKTEFGNK